MLRFAFPLAIVAGFVSLAIADIPPPPPEAGFKRVPFEHVVKVAAEIPGYKFYAFRGGVFGDQSIGDELKLGKEKGVAVSASSSVSVRSGVVAVPAKLTEAANWKETLGKSMNRREKEGKLPAGVVIYEARGTFRDLKVSDKREKVEKIITFSANEEAGVKYTEKDTTGPAAKEGAALEDSPRSPIATLMAGLAASLAAVAMGVWWFRGSEPRPESKDGK